MTFLEALQALKDQKCRAIKRKTWVQRTFVVGMEYLHDTKDDCPAFDLMGIDNFLTDDWELVDPIPQTETVEVKRWGVYDENCKGINSYECEEDARQHACSYTTPQKPLHVVELVGIDVRPIKPKVKHREELQRNTFDSVFTSAAPGTKFFAEWKE